MSILKFLGLTSGGGIGTGLGLGTKSGRNFLLGEKGGLKKFDQFSPEQQQLFGQMTGALGQGDNYGNALGVLQQYLNPKSGAYQNFEAPFMRQFNEHTVPKLAERFAGASPTGGGLSSSAFGQSLSSAGAGLQENLASLRSQLQLGAAEGIFGQYNKALGQQPFGYVQNQASQGMLAQLLPMLLRAYMGGG